MTMTMRLAAGAILAGFLALLMLAAAACWSGELAPVTELPRPSPSAAPHDISREATCGELELAIGRVPAAPDYSACAGESDPADYWFCLSSERGRYADHLAAWAMTAVAVCSP
jgi:hypothetical protein